jgi:hypothetical protein
MIATVALIEEKTQEARMKLLGKANSFILAIQQQQGVYNMLMAELRSKDIQLHV